jgi:hypothetical protein
LSPEDEFLVDVVRVTAHHIDIVLRSGNGEPFKYTLNMSSGPGEFRVPLSQFKSLWNNQPLGAARAADIDGIHVFGHGHIGTKFGKFAIATGAPADNTPPVITADVSGTLGSNGWYTSDVSVSWSVTDPDSPVSSSSGCGAASVTSDTNGTTFTCTATSAGGTSTRSVTVKRDATNPDVALVGNAGSYTVDQVVSITCSISDAMSGLASQACNGASGPAYTFSVGSNPVSATAADNAGNSASASGSFTVSVTAGSLCNLVNQWVTQRGVANALCEQLANGAYRAFRNHVKAQAGKHVPADKAPILLGLADHL